MDIYHGCCYGLSALGIFLMVLNANTGADGAYLGCTGFAKTDASYARAFLVGFGANRFAVAILNAMAFESNRELLGTRTDAALATAETVAVVWAAGVDGADIRVVPALLFMRIAWHVLEVVALHLLGSRAFERHTRRAHVHEEHLIGRHTAITMIMLGEAVLQLTTGVSTLNAHESGSYTFSVAGFTLVFALAVLTFNTVPRIGMHALGRSKKRGAVWRILSARPRVGSERPSGGKKRTILGAVELLHPARGLRDQARRDGPVAGGVRRRRSSFKAAPRRSTSYSCKDYSAAEKPSYPSDDDHRDDDHHDDGHHRRSLADGYAPAAACPDSLVKEGHASFMSFSLTGAMVCYLVIRLNHKGFVLRNVARLYAYGARAVVSLGHVLIFLFYRDDLSADRLLVRHALAAVAACVLDGLLTFVDFLLAGKHRRDDDHVEFAAVHEEGFSRPSRSMLARRFSAHVRPRSVIQRVLERRRLFEAVRRSSTSVRKSDPGAAPEPASPQGPFRKSAPGRTSSVDARDGSFVELRGSSVGGSSAARPPPASPRTVRFSDNLV